MFSFFDKFRKKKEESYDVTHLSIDDLDVGFLFDFKGEHWEVSGKHRYEEESEEGDITESFELEIKSATETCFLEKSEDEDNPGFICMKRIPVGKLGSNLRSRLLKGDEPPSELEYENRRYYLESQRAAYYFKNCCKGEGDPVISWNYEDDEETHYLVIEQWSDTEFEASVGFFIEEHQIMNILPGGGE